MTDLLALRAALRARHRLSDETALADLLSQSRLEYDERQQAATLARGWIEAIRAETSRFGGPGDFLQEFGLSTAEGVALLCVAEALLRVPDAATADDLIRDKLASIDWSQHASKTGTFFANASVWGLMLTGKLFDMAEEGQGLLDGLGNLVARVGQPVIRTAVSRAMGLLGDQFVLGRTIAEALDNAQSWQRQGYCFSYDMLGEGARTAADAERYFQSYLGAIQAIAGDKEAGDVYAAPGISVKLSAIHPRFSESQRGRCLPDLVARVTTLAEAAAKANITLTIDAEESERLELQIDLMAELLKAPVTANWAGLGMAVQAYQKRAPAVLSEMAGHLQATGRQMTIRLVKGAYWDSEIKRAQMLGLADYPVYTRKVATDVSYLACARQMLALQGRVFPAFGTHNAYTIASILTIAPKAAKFEFQRLHGMGVEVHAEAVKRGFASRIYAPVGGHRDLLAYLVRRILENGANSSFVHRARDVDVPIAALVHDPAEEFVDFAEKRNTAIPLPEDLFKAEDRTNSAGLDLDAPAVTGPLLTMLEAYQKWEAAPLINGQRKTGTPQVVVSPADLTDALGSVVTATSAHVDEALALAHKAQPAWAATAVETRAAVLDKAAELFEQHRDELIALIGREAGRTIKNAVAEVREAVDLCRYYAACARFDLVPQKLEGYTGERNVLTFAPRGIVAAISPWNFPLAIFVGQVAAALVAGNAVMAKPAEQTPLVGFRAVELLLQAGVPAGVLAFLPGAGEVVGAQLVKDPRVNLIVFTGSTEVGRLINQQLAARSGPIVPLIAETGGLNCLIVDSTALPEQVTDDVLQSAFDSAGQRCSSLRVLFLQEDVADKMLEMVKGATAELKAGHPLDLASDLGPIIDRAALEGLRDHLKQFGGDVGEPCPGGFYLRPRILEIESLSQLQREAFGPILHVIRFKADEIDEVVRSINASGYGLTCGIHSRREGFVRQLSAKLHVGNIYVNRNLIGAIPGLQPFGGEGLSGTGPKAGGPLYLYRFCTERHISTDTTAAGGNASLLMQGH